jgi:hypothetical protein
MGNRLADGKAEGVILPRRYFPARRKADTALQEGGSFGAEVGRILGAIPAGLKGVGRES